MKKLLTIGMATYDDYEGVYFTLQSIRLHHPRTMNDDIEFIVLDNNPSSVHGKKCEDTVRHIKNGRYIPYTEQTSSFSKYKILEEAQGEYYLGLDCHVLLEPGFVDTLLLHYDSNPNTIDLIQGPLILDDLKMRYSHFKPEWRGNMYGTWATDSVGLESGQPFDIPMQGMGMFSCRTSAFPKISKRFNAFGGEEGYIHKKFHQQGGRTLCIPSLGWVHRFNRVNALPYKNTYNDICRNYIIGYLDLYQDTEHPLLVEAMTYFEKFLKKDDIRSILENEKNIICR